MLTIGNFPFFREDTTRHVYIQHSIMKGIFN